MAGRRVIMNTRLTQISEDTMKLFPESEMKIVRTKKVNRLLKYHVRAIVLYNKTVVIFAYCYVGYRRKF